MENVLANVFVDAQRSFYAPTTFPLSTYFPFTLLLKNNEQSFPSYIATDLFLLNFILFYFLISLYYFTFDFISSYCFIFDDDGLEDVSGLPRDVLSTLR